MPTLQVNTYDSMISWRSFVVSLLCQTTTLLQHSARKCWSNGRAGWTRTNDQRIMSSFGRRKSYQHPLVRV